MKKAAVWIPIVLVCVVLVFLLSKNNTAQSQSSLASPATKTTASYDPKSSAVPSFGTAGTPTPSLPGRSPKQTLDAAQSQSISDIKSLIEDSMDYLGEEDLLDIEEP